VLAQTYGTPNVGTSLTLTPTLTGLADPADYAITYVANTSGSITAKTLTVTANSQTITYGALVPVDTISYSGFASNENVRNLTVAPTVASILSGAPSIGTYAGNYVVSGGLSENYEFVYKSGSLVVVLPSAIPTAVQTASQNASALFGANIFSSGALTNSLLSAAPLNWDLENNQDDTQSQQIANATATPQPATFKFPDISPQTASLFNFGLDTSSLFDFDFDVFPRAQTPGYNFGLHVEHAP
jgi:hypothetical protein